MMKWVRWGGFLAFLAVMGTVTALWWVFVDGVVRRTIETEGTGIVGARVELEHADLSVFPAGLALTGLRITDPDRPMTNAVEVARVTFAVDPLNLLRRKVIVDEMTVEGLRFGTARTRSGAVASRSSGGGDGTLGDGLSEVASAFSLPALEAPDVKTILAEENLETLQLIETLKADVQQQMQQWTQRIKDLPGKQTFDTYRGRIEKLKGATRGGLGGILGGVGEIRSIQTEIERDLADIKNTHKEFGTTLASLRARLKEAVDAPQADVRRLREKYSLSPQGLANLSGPLLGQHIGAWARQAVAWHERLKPVLQRVKEAGDGGTGPEVIKPRRGRGADVRFKETHPVPDFLVRRAKVSLELDIGDLAGEIQNITPDQDVLGKPLIFKFSGEKLEGLRSVVLKGSLNHVQPANPRDRVDLRAQGYRITAVPISTQPAWPVALKRGVADLRVGAGLRGNRLTANFTCNIKSMNITAGKHNDSNPLTMALSSAVSGLSSLSIRADLRGTPDDYAIKVRSDLDRILKRAAGNLVRDLTSRFEKRLAAAVSRKVKGPLKELQSGFAGLNGINGDLAHRLAQGNDLLGSALKQGVSPGGLPGGLKLPF